MAADTTEPIIQYAKDKLLAYGIGDAAVETSIGGLKCYLQNEGVEAGGDDKEYKDNVGETCALIISDIHQVLSCDGLVIKGNSGAMPKKGDEVTGIPTVDGLETTGVHFRVKTCNVQWSNEDVAKVNLTIRGYKF